MQPLYKCPNGHVSLTRTEDGVYCESCSRFDCYDREYYAEDELVDTRMGSRAES